MTPDLIINGIMAIVIAVVGWVIRTLVNKVEVLEQQVVTEHRVRSIISDKSEALHLADRTSSERQDRLEDRLDKIDVKLDQIMAIVSHLNSGGSHG